jgi:trigger factor
MQKELLEKIAVEKKAGSEVTMTGEIPYAELEKHKESALTAVGKEVSIDGFRKGHVPEAVLIQKVGEMAIITEMAERALARVYPELVTLHSLDVIGYPKISITKIAKDNPLGFSITVAVVPEVTLPDYVKVAKEVNKAKDSMEVTEEEVTKQVEDILRQKVAYERLQKKAGANADHVHGPDCDHEEVNGETREAGLGHHEGHDHAEPEETPVDEVNAEGGEGGLGQKAEDIKLPELTDEYVKTLGKEGQFTSVEDFRNKIKEHLTIEKARDVDSRHRAKITDAIIEKTKVELPQVLVDAEIGQMYAQMASDLERAQLKMEDYLGHIKKTKEDLTKEWTPMAEKRAKLQLVLNEIAKKENVIPDPSLVDHEVSHLLEHYKDADEKRVRVYVASVLTNEAVMKKLEEIV